uniref:Transcription initiation factor TFIID subunit 8 n=1 Tax=Kalanchoe fedtschenkoi TaxID=63787 RepID=A0A7N0SYM0_KALFE
MRDGAGESGRDFAQQNGSSSNSSGSHSSNKRVKYSGDEFGRAVAKIAVAQVCESVGYQGFQQSALETLSNVAVRYIEGLGKGAKFHANLAGRTGCNIFDIVQSLEDFEAVQGFPGASEIDRCVASSGTVKELIQYVSEAEEIPFAYDVPQFPIVKDRKLAPSFLQGEVEPPGCHIPSWLPAFPDPLTFVSTSEKVGRGDNVEQTAKFESLGKRMNEPPLLSLDHLMSHNKLEGLSADASNSSAGINPFLAPPLKHGAVEVSPVAFPRKPAHDTSPVRINPENHVHSENHFSEKEKFTHTANQPENHFHASGDEKSTTLTSLRPVVKFRIKVNQKYLTTSLDPGDDQNGVSDGTAPLKMVETDKKGDEMKWLADPNLNGPIETPDELAQM